MAPCLSQCSPSPLQIWGSVWLKGGVSKRRSALRDLEDRVPSLPCTQLPGGFDAIVRKRVIKRLRKPSKKTWRIDIQGADFTSGAVAPASLPASCLLWVFTAMHICSHLQPCTCNSVFYKYHLSRFPISSWSVKSLPEFGLCPSFPGSASCCPKGGLTGLASGPG